VARGRWSGVRTAGCQYGKDGSPPAAFPVSTTGKALTEASTRAAGGLNVPEL